MAAPTAPVMCFNGKMYYNSGSYGSPTWVLISNVGDIEVSDSMSKVQLPLRAGAGFMFNEPGLRDLSFAFKQMWDPADTTQDAIQTAYAARSVLDVILLDQAQGTAGSSGPRAVTKVFKCQREESPLDGVMMLAVEIAPAYSSNVPSVYTAV